MRWEWQESRQAFTEAARWFVDAVGQVGDRWEAPGLGEWDVRALVGHTSRSLLTVESYLAQPAEQVTVPTAVAYYEATREIARGPGVASRGVDAGAALSDDPAGAVAGILARVLALLEPLDGDELLTTLVGGMRLVDYLPTRSFELVVHTADLGLALGLDLRAPEAPARQALGLVAELALADGVAGRLLLVATGRAAGPFSVL